MFSTLSVLNPVLRSTRFWIPLVFLASSSGQLQSVHAQKAASATKVTGKLVSVAKKGRNTVMTIETADKETKEFQMTGRAKLDVTAKGDSGFLTKGQFVTAQPVLTNDKLFAQKFTVHVGPGRKVGGVKKAGKQIGVSAAAWDVAGQITDRAPDKDFKDYEVIMLRAGKRQVGVFFKKGFTVTVKLADVSLAEPGSSVTIEGKPGSRDRFTVSSATVVLAKPLKAEEVLADDKSSKKRRSTSKKKSASKKSDKDE